MRVARCPLGDFYPMIPKLLRQLIMRLPDGDGERKFLWKYMDIPHSTLRYDNYFISANKQDVDACGMFFLVLVNAGERAEALSSRKQNTLHFGGSIAVMSSTDSDDVLAGTSVSSWFVKRQSDFKISFIVGQTLLMDGVEVGVFMGFLMI